MQYAIFAAAGAFSAGVEVQIDSIAHGAHLSRLLVSSRMSVPAASGDAAQPSFRRASANHPVIVAGCVMAVPTTTAYAPADLAA